MGKVIRPKKVLVYEDEHGNEPFSEWFKGLKDIKGKERIGARIRRLSEGLYGDCESVGEGVSELECFLVRDTESILVKRLTIL